jgi:hypothetical protein
MPTQLDMYIAHQKEFVREYNGKIIALKDGEVQGAYPTITEALEDMASQFAPGEFMIIKCTPGDEEYVKKIRQQVTFLQSGKDIDMATISL